MKFPKIVRIGPLFFGVEFVDGLLDATKTDKLNGHISYDKCTISIERGVSDQRKRATLWHEIVHGIACIAEIEMTETDVERFTNVLLSVLIDNPELRDID